MKTTNKNIHSLLTDCPEVTPYGDMRMGRHWFKYGLVACRHYLNQCWFSINEIPWHSFQSKANVNTQDINPHVVIEICTFAIIATFRRGHALHFFTIIIICPWCRCSNFNYPCIRYRITTWCLLCPFHSVPPWRCGCNSKSEVFLSRIYVFNSFCEVALR